MSFWKNVYASLLDQSAKYGEQMRDRANYTLEAHGDRMSEQQREKSEAWAYSSAPEEARAKAEQIRDELE